MKRIAILIIAAALAAPAWAGVSSCDADLQSAGYCSDVGNEHVYSLRMPNAKMDELESLLQNEKLEDRLQALLYFAFANRKVCDANDVLIGVCGEATTQSVVSFTLPSQLSNWMADWVRPVLWDTVECVALADGGTQVTPGTVAPDGVPHRNWMDPEFQDPVGSADCTVGQTIDNPINRRRWAYKELRNETRLEILIERFAVAIAAAEAGLDADVDDVGD